MICEISTKFIRRSERLGYWQMSRSVVETCFIWPSNLYGNGLCWRESQYIRGAFVAHWKEINFNKGDLIEYNGQVYAVQALEQALEDFEEQRKN